MKKLNEPIVRYFLFKAVSKRHSIGMANTLLNKNQSPDPKFYKTVVNFTYRFVKNQQTINKKQETFDKLWYRFDKNYQTFD
jgi:hypothetical protein